MVFAGQDHFYERIKPQNGIYHWVCAAGGSRKGDIVRTAVADAEAGRLKLDATVRSPYHRLVDVSLGAPHAGAERVHAGPDTP